MTAPHEGTLPRIYRDSDSIYLAFANGLQLRFPFTEGGLHKALDHIPKLPGPVGYLSGGRNITKAPQGEPKVAKHTANARAIADGSPELKAKTWEIVRKNLLKYDA